MRAPAYTLRRSGQSPSDVYDEGSLAAKGESRILQNVRWHAPAVQTPRRASGTEGVAATVAAATTAASATCTRQRAGFIDRTETSWERTQREKEEQSLFLYRADRCESSLRLERGLLLLEPRLRKSRAAPA